MPVYIVSDGRVILFPDATVAKMAAHGNTVHVIRNEEIIGNFPTKSVRFYGTELPPTFKQDYENQLAWEKLTPAERAVQKAKVQSERKGDSAGPNP